MEPSGRIHILDQSFIYLPSSGSDKSAEQGSRAAIISSNRPAEDAAALLEQKKPQSKAISITQQMSDDLASVPRRIFDEEKTTSSQGSTQKKSWVSSSSHTPVDGFAKGVFAFGKSFVKGVAGVFVDPIEGAKKEGGVGFVKGLGKGMAGLIFRPLSGAMLLTSKTIEGFVNTPDTIAWGVTRHFGVPLQLSLARAAQKNQVHITTKCFQYIALRGLDFEGIFRLSSQQSQLDAVRALIDDGDDVDLAKELQNPSDVASLIKMYFRMLPDPLVPFAFYDQVVELMARFDDPNYDEDETLNAFKNILAQFPVENRLILLQFCALANEIVANSDKNRMSVDNLAIVLSPSIIRPPENKDDSLEARAKVLVQMTSVQLAFKLMVTKFNILFNAEELLAAQK